MCGLVGAVGDISHPVECAIKTLLLLDVVRGPHSTGLLMVGKYKNDYHLPKAVGHPYNMFDEWDCFDDKGNIKPVIKVAIGHNRFATTGDINEANAHPFVHGVIGGAHNGTLRSVFRLDDGDKFDVDSEAIFFDLNNNGPKETIPKLNGAYALTWYNFKEKKFYMIRNHERPLYYVITKDGKNLLYASEDWMLMIACNRHKIEYNKIEKVETNHLFSIEVGDNVNSSKYKVKVVDEGALFGWSASVQTNVVQIGGGNSVANPFPGPKTSTADQYMAKVRRSRGTVKDAPGLSKEEMEKFVGKNVEFYIEGNEEGADNGPKYLPARTIVYDEFEIRVIAMGHPIYSELIERACTWTGNIRKVVEYLDTRSQSIVRYAILDLSTIKEVKSVAKVKSLIQSPKHFGYNGEELTADQWRDATCNGCAWCSTPYTEGLEIKFVNDKEFFCKECQSIPEAKAFFEDTILF